MLFKSKQKRVWAEINLNNAEHNYQYIRSLLGDGVRLCCVVKANAYGHGAVFMADFYERLGADVFAVSNIEEGIQLRKAGISKPILILGYTPPLCAGELAEYRLSQCVYSLAYGQALSLGCQADKVSVPIHIKIDTGMGRIGFQYREPARNTAELEEALKVCRLPGLITEGIFMHFASADEGAAGAEFTRKQYSCFREACDYLTANGAEFSVRHCSNSAAIMELPECRMDMVRAGIVLYGLKPSAEVKGTENLKAVMTLKSVVSHIKKIGSGDTVSYGRTYTAPGPVTVATIPIGYADGYLRSNAEKNTMLIRGRKVPVLGRICMDQVMVDVSGIEDITVGDEAVIFGEAPALTADEAAENCGTIGYEAVCTVGERVPRVYIYNGEIVKVQDNILN